MWSVGKKVFLTVLASVCMAAAGAQAADLGFLKAEGNKLMLNSREYRAIGADAWGLFWDYTGTFFHMAMLKQTPETARQNAVDAILAAERCKIAFFRFNAAPGYPIDVDNLYAKDPDAYWRQMDELIALCGQHHIKLIPSLTLIATWSSYYGEPRQAYLDPKSKCSQAAYRYMREFVSRHKDDPNILMWELSNEIFHFADLNMTGRPAWPRGVYSPGSTAFHEKLVFEDSLTTGMICQLVREWTSFIKSMDSNHLVDTGDAAPRRHSVGLRNGFPKGQWVLDTMAQHTASLLMQQAKPLDVISLHLYGPNGGSKNSAPDGLSELEYGRRMIRAAREAGRPVFVGEFGNARPFIKDDPTAQWSRDCIDMMEQEGVSLAAFWVWYFPWQDADKGSRQGFNLYSDTSPPLMKRIAEFNEKHGALEFVP